VFSTAAERTLTLHRPATGISDGGRWRRILAAVLLVLLCGAADRAMAAESGEKSQKGGGEGAVEGPTYVRLPPIVLPVFEGNRITRRAGIVLALELEPGKTEAELEPKRRQLYDAYISDLYALYDEESGTGRVIDAVRIKQRLQSTTDRILGPGFVHEVLIQQAYERPQS
jgi:flagellar basal body-associated protein FliL